jgi:hypothetical protein
MADHDGYPEYKLLLQYNLLPEKQEFFFHYIRGEFAPSLKNMGLELTSMWHVVYGNGTQPLSQMEFVCENRAIARAILKHPRWYRLESRLQTYTRSYKRKLIRFEDRFQF